MRISLVTLLLLAIAPGTAGADSFVAVPKLDGAKTSEGLQIKFVRYTGGTNGEMIVDVKNTSKRIRTFAAEGIFFVPKGDPEKSPQRLGAAGPFDLVQGKRRQEQNELSLQPGQVERLHLAVFCIDSHRSSPSASHEFKIAKKRVPKQLRAKIKAGTKRIIHQNKGNSKARATKSAIQSHVWKSRDKDWIPLEGERAQEKAPPRIRKHRNRRPQIQEQRR